MNYKVKINCARCRFEIFMYIVLLSFVILPLVTTSNEVNHIRHSTNSSNRTNSIELEYDYEVSLDDDELLIEEDVQYVETTPWEQLSKTQQQQFGLQSKNGKIFMHMAKDLAMPTTTYFPYQFSFIVEGIREKKEFHYGKTDTYVYQLLEQLSLIDKRILVIDSIPLYELVALEYGAKEVVVVVKNETSFEYDYNNYNERLRYITMSNFEEQWSTNENNGSDKFDIILAISAIQYRGLGRYNEPIDAWADLKFMNEMLKWIKTDGLLIFSVPVGEDAVVYNLHRIYGYDRLALLTQCWYPMATVGFGDADPFLNKETSKKFDKQYGYHQPLIVVSRLADEVLPPFCKP